MIAPIQRVSRRRSPVWAFPESGTASGGQDRAPRPTGSALPGPPREIQAQEEHRENPSASRNVYAHPGCARGRSRQVPPPRSLDHSRGSRTRFHSCSSGRGLDVEVNGHGEHLPTCLPHPLKKRLDNSATPRKNVQSWCRSCRRMPGSTRKTAWRMLDPRPSS